MALDVLDYNCIFVQLQIGIDCISGDQTKFPNQSHGGLKGEGIIFWPPEGCNEKARLKLGRKLAVTIFWSPEMFFWLP